MGGHNRKTARNEEVKKLWASGKYTQIEIAGRYGLTQGRVSNIIHGRLPSQRYCNYCKKGFRNFSKYRCDLCGVRVRLVQKFRALLRRKRKVEERTNRRLLRKLYRDDARIHENMVRAFRRVVRQTILSDEGIEIILLHGTYDNAAV